MDAKWTDFEDLDEFSEENTLDRGYRDLWLFCSLSIPRMTCSIAMYLGYGR
jgi:hypothetical protein